MITKSGIIYSEGFNRNAVLTMIDTYIEDNEIRVPKGTPEKELTDAFTASFNRVAAKGYTINLDEEGIFPPWSNGYTDVESDIGEEDIPEDETLFWKPTEGELEELIWEAIERTF
ncbi:hypothetical protein NE857_09295 [Nocardiopsis exhalans]|uniref:Uncharacterized protein n=1 Tax=Nocardiopsis exhalans TaxID=163604 RepID=A0ABY5DFA0_9ACTN|nr:hypothetical protein [Nocardiopsis exhalans]USY21776.1 hypothetical protein NE857_09295 [Nocardiopsis exhalans]